MYSACLSRVALPICRRATYTILRRDAKAANETDLIIYISNVLPYKHMSHLDQPVIEATWLEISTSKSTPILVGYCYRNPASRVDWMHDFTAMMDNVAFESIDIPSTSTD